MADADIKPKKPDQIERWAERGEWRPIENAVLERALDRASGQPVARITLSELIRELAGEGANAVICAAVETAADNLKEVALLHAKSDFIEPTIAAVRASELVG